MHALSDGSVLLSTMVHAEAVSLAMITATTSSFNSGQRDARCFFFDFRPRKFRAERLISCDDHLHRVIDSDHHLDDHIRSIAMDSNSTNHAEEEDIFAGLKKKSKKSSTTTTSSKEVEFDLDPTIAASTTPDSAAAAPATAAEVADEEDLDFSELKKMKKKKKKVVQLQLSSDDEQDSQPVRSRVDALGNEIIEPAVPLASTAEGGAATGTTTSKSDGSSSAPGAAADGTAATAAAGDGMDEFADLKKKKRKGGGKKSTFDLEAFEAELASSSSTAAAAASSVEGTPAGSDGEENGDDEPVEGEDPFARNAGGAAEDGEAVLLSKAEQAAVDKDWLKEGQTERDYSYTEVCFHHLLFLRLFFAFFHFSFFLHLLLLSVFSLHCAPLCTD